MYAVCMVKFIYVAGDEYIYIYIYIYIGCPKNAFLENKIFQE